MFTDLIVIDFYFYLIFMVHNKY